MPIPTNQANLWCGKTTHALNADIPYEREWFIKKRELPKNGAAILRFHVFLHRIPQPAMPFPKQLFVAPPVELGVETQPVPAMLTV